MILPADVAPTLARPADALWLEDEVAGFGLGCIAVDGSRSVDEIAGVVAGRFALVGGGGPGG